MIERVVITGPLAPADVSDLLAERDRALAHEIRGYRGIPTSELVKSLVAAGVQVEVVTHAQGLDGSLELNGPNLRVLVAPQRARARDRALDLFRQERRAMGELLRQTEAELIHALWTYEFAWAALDTGRPVLVAAQDAPLTVLRHFRDAYRGLRTLMAYIVRARTCRLTAVSPYLASAWGRQMLYRRPITVIPNMIAEEFFAVSPAAAAGGAVVIDVTDASPLKNNGPLIEATHILRSQGHDVTLTLAGAGLGPDDPFARATRGGEADGAVRFLGVLDRQAVAAALSEAAVFVHTSLEESFGISIAEAMAAGVPVIGGARSGAVPWLLAGGDAGMLVDVREPRAIARAIGSLLGDPDLAQELARAGRARARDAFSTPAVTAAVLDEYERLRTQTAA